MLVWWPAPHRARTGGGDPAARERVMKQLQPVIWSKGTFLTPQHLQTQDRFIEGVLGFHIEALNCRPWGFKDLTLDLEKLAEGQITITRASGLFPDSLAFDIPIADAVPASKPIAEFFETDQTQLDVYLAVPDFRDYGDVGGRLACGQSNGLLQDIRSCEDLDSLKAASPAA